MVALKDISKRQELVTFFYSCQDKQMFLENVENLSRKVFFLVLTVSYFRIYLRCISIRDGLKRF